MDLLVICLCGGSTCFRPAEVDGATPPLRTPSLRATVMLAPALIAPPKHLSFLTEPIAFPSTYRCTRQRVFLGGGWRHQAEEDFISLNALCLVSDVRQQNITAARGFLVSDLAGPSARFFLTAQLRH